MTASALNDKQEAFCDLILSGVAPKDALTRAGYRAVRDPADVLSKPAVVARLRKAITHELASLAPLAVDTIRLIMLTPGVSPAVKLDAARTVLDRTGYPALPHSAASAAGGKELTQLSRQDLLNVIAECQAALSDRAESVTDPRLAPRIIEGKAIELTDLL